MSNFRNCHVIDLPFFGFVGPVPLSAVLEPVADLRRCQPSYLGQSALFPRRRIRIPSVAILQDRSGLLLETVRRLLAVPYRRWQRVLSPVAVFTYSAERSTARLFGFCVVRLEPERLEASVVVAGKCVRLQQPIKLFVVTSVERHDCLRFQNALVFVEMIAGGQRPQEPGQSVYAARVLQDL